MFFFCVIDSSEDICVNKFSELDGSLINIIVCCVDEDMFVRFEVCKFKDVVVSGVVNDRDGGCSFERYIVRDDGGVGGFVMSKGWVCVKRYGIYMIVNGNRINFGIDVCNNFSIFDI